MKTISDVKLNQVDEAIKKLENQTTGEIMVVVNAVSYHYPLASLKGGMLLALLTASLVSVYGLDGHIYTFVMVLLPLVYLMQFFVNGLPWLKKLFISEEELKEEVYEGAVSQFFRQGLVNTKERNGVLIYLSEYERRACILADQGINDLVPPGRWDEIMNHLVGEMKLGRLESALQKAVEETGELLKQHFPATGPNTNELRNVIRGN